MSLTRFSPYPWDLVVCTAPSSDIVKGTLLVIARREGAQVVYMGGVA